MTHLPGVLSGDEIGSRFYGDQLGFWAVGGLHFQMDQLDYICFGSFARIWIFRDIDGLWSALGACWVLVAKGTDKAIVLLGFPFSSPGTAVG